MENDKVIAALKESGARSYGKRLYNMTKVAFANVVGSISTTANGVSLAIKGSKESVYVPIAPGVAIDKKSYDIALYTAEEDGSGTNKTTGLAWAVKKGQTKFMAV